jgi:signal transduction histidine kinase
VTSQLYETVKELEVVNARLEETNGALDATNQSLREFVAVASHDMRGPLTAILGYSSMLLQRFTEIPSERQVEFIATINNQGERLHRLVDDLLTVSRLEAGALESYPRDVKLDDAVHESVRSLGDRATLVTVSAPCDVVVLADPDHVQRILTNYLGNALKYGEPPVLTEAVRNDAYVEVRVRDQGAGVPEEFVPRLFGKFARGEDARSRAEGTGLGLSIVRGLARVNGGDAWYEPNVPHGSCFAVRLPLFRAA